MTLSRPWIVLAGALLGGCAGLTDELLPGGSAGVATLPSSAGEACVVAEAPAGGDLPAGRVIRCAEVAQPAGRLALLSERTAVDGLAQRAGRSGLAGLISGVAICAEPVLVELVPGHPAARLDCAKRASGAPYLGLVLPVANGTVLAHGLASAEAALRLEVARKAGLPTPAPLPPRPGQPQGGVADEARFRVLMAAGTQQNLNQDFGPSLESFREAVALSARLVGPQSPRNANAIGHLALAHSNLANPRLAELLFGRAMTLARVPDTLAPDRLVEARLRHYEAHHFRNEARYDQALAAIAEAETRYAAVAPDAAQLIARAGSEENRALPVAISFGNDPRIDPGDILRIDTLSRRSGLETALAAQGLADLLRLRALIAYEGAASCAAADEAALKARRVAALLDSDPESLRARSLRVSAAARDCDARRPEALAAATVARDELTSARPGTLQEITVRIERGRYLFASGNEAAGLTELREAVTVARRVRLSLPAPTLAALLDPLFARLGNRAEGEDAAELFGMTTLRATGRTASDLAETAAIKAGASSALYAFREARNRRDALVATRERALATGAEPSRIAALDVEIVSATRRLAASERLAFAERPEFAALADQRVSAGEVIAALARDEAVFTLVQAEDAAYAFLLRKDGASAWRVSLPEAEARQAVATLRSGLEPKPDGALAPFDLQASFRLWRRLMADRPRMLEGVGTLFVTVSGPLGALPFGVLVTREPLGSDSYATAGWMLRERAIAVLPSAGSLVSLRRVARPSAASEPYLGLGGFVPFDLAAARRTLPDPGCEQGARGLAGASPLPLSRGEVEGAARVLGAGADAVMTGAAFTRAGLLGRDLQRYRIVHFAAHAVLPGEIPCIGQPSIVASAPPSGAPEGEGIIGGADILSLRLDADLVVLSACNTAGPDADAAGEAFSGLARAFLYAGSRAVAATGWTVSDGSTALIALQSMRAAQGRVDPGVLRTTQLELLDAAEAGLLPKAWTHPHHWAAFSFVGAPRALRPTASLDPSARVAAGAPAEGSRNGTVPASNRDPGVPRVTRAARPELL